MRTPRSLLYLTTEGLLQPIGYSQVFRLLVGLARRRMRCVVISLERHLDSAQNEEGIRRISAELGEASVEWVRIPYLPAATLAHASVNLIRMAVAARRVLQQHSIDLVHARGAVVGIIALGLTLAFRVPFLLDVRGYLIDERLAEGRWFGHPILLRLARAMERRVFSSCAGAVTLTSTSAADIAGGRFGPWDAHKPIAVIPTCADYEMFGLQRHRGATSGSSRERLSEKLVVGYVGALNRSYRVRQALDLFRYLKEIRPDAHLVCLTHQETAMRTAIDEAGISAGNVTVRSAAPWEMPGWLAEIDWGLHLLETGEAKRASVPTKLAEFFASGVRPIHYGCNEEVSRWVDRCGSGYVLPSTDDTALREGAGFVARAQPSRSLLEAARRISRPHFGLEAGLDRYQEIFRQLLPDSDS